MPYSYNIRSFKTVRTANGVGLLAKCYSMCVYLELCLKSDARLLTYSNGGHDVPRMLRNVTAHNPMTGRMIGSLATQLENKLKSLYCQDISQRPVTVDPRKHPHMRYLRHMTDWLGSAQVSSDADLLGILNLIDQICLILRFPNTSLPL